MHISRSRTADAAVRDGDPDDEVIEIEPGELSGIFSAPQWLRDLGFTAWLLVGVGGRAGRGRSGCWR